MDVQTFSKPTPKPIPHQIGEMADPDTQKRSAKFYSHVQVLTFFVLLITFLKLHFYGCVQDMFVISDMKVRR